MCTIGTYVRAEFKSACQKYGHYHPLTGAKRRFMEKGGEDKPSAGRKVRQCRHKGISCSCPRVQGGEEHCHPDKAVDSSSKTRKAVMREMKEQVDEWEWDGLPSEFVRPEPKVVEQKPREHIRVVIKDEGVQPLGVPGLAGEKLALPESQITVPPQEAKRPEVRIVKAAPVYCKERVLHLESLPEQKYQLVASHSEIGEEFVADVEEDLPELVYQQRYLHFLGRESLEQYYEIEDDDDWNGRGCCRSGRWRAFGWWVNGKNYATSSNDRDYTLDTSSSEAYSAASATTETYYPWYYMLLPKRWKQGLEESRVTNFGNVTELRSVYDAVRLVDICVDLYDFLMAQDDVLKFSAVRPDGKINTAILHVVNSRALTWERRAELVGNVDVWNDTQGVVINQLVLIALKRARTAAGTYVPINRRGALSGRYLSSA